MTEIDAMEGLRVRARLAVACGALEIPGGSLASALDAAAPAGPVAFGSDARLDRLAIGWVAPAAAVDDVLHAIDIEPEPVWRWLEALGGGSTSVELEVDREGSAVASLQARIDRPVSAAVDALGRCGAPPAAVDGLASAVWALGVPLARTVGVAAGARRAWSIGLELPLGDGASGERLAEACTGAASEAQARWQAALLGALGPGRARVRVLIEAGESGLERISVRYPRVVPETLLRAVLPLASSERAAATLGALSAAAGEDGEVAIEPVAHGAEPPLVRVWFGA